MSTSERAAPATEGDLGFSLVRGDIIFHLQRRLGLIPADGLGIGRRALFFALVTYAPIAVWAVLAGRALPGAAGEPLLQHFGVQVRCLVAIPLFIASEGLAHARTSTLLPYFLTAGLVAQADAPRFRETVRGIVRLRNTTTPWITIVTLVAAWTAFSTVHQTHEVVWAAEGERPSLGFGGWWYVYVSRPVYLVLLFGWVWRLVLLTVSFVRIGRLPLAIVPTHPDRLGGLGFLERIPSGFQPFVLGASAVVSAGWAHDVVYHGVELDSLRAPMVAFVLVVLVVVLAPLVVFAPRLMVARRRALLEYGSLVGEHGRLVRRRWILREPTDDDEGLLSAPEIGPVADTIALYGAVREMRSMPVGKAAVLAVAIPAIVPILCVVAIRVPVKDLILTVAKALV